MVLGESTVKVQRQVVGNHPVPPPDFEDRRLGLPSTPQDVGVVCRVIVVIGSRTVESLIEGMRLGVVRHHPRRQPF